MLKRLSLFIFLASFGLAAQAQDVTVDDILDNYFEITGGLENWKSLNSMKMTGLVNAQNMEYTMVITLARPNKYRVDTDIQGQSLIYAYDGEDTWWLSSVETGLDPQTMADLISEAMGKEKFEDDFIDYAEKGHSVELLGTKEVDGTETYEIKLTKENGDVEFHYFDTEYFVLIMQKVEEEEGPQKGQFVETFLSDYQEVEGMMIPHFIEEKINGLSIRKTTFKEIDLNPEVDEAVFSRPNKE